MANCPWCGTPLKVVNNQWFCPNHGFVDIDTGEDEEETPTSYFG